MDRCAVFVDAGYLYAEGGKLCCRISARKHILLDAETANRTLTELATNASRLPSLRTYWYDGAREGIPTTAQQMVAALPNVKLRLGRLNVKGQQKGVDALIYRDLMTLARERAISDAFLLSGDEDLREGVRAAQDMGVRVTLIGICTHGNTHNQSRELVNEVDETIELTKEQLSAFLSRRKPPTGSTLSNDDPMTSVSTAAGNFAEQWLKKAAKAELSALLAVRPRIPVELDTDLLVSIENALGGTLRGQDQLRRTARQAFWQEVGDSNRETSVSQ